MERDFSIRPYINSCHHTFRLAYDWKYGGGLKVGSGGYVSRSLYPRVDGRPASDCDAFDGALAPRRHFRASTCATQAFVVRKIYGDVVLTPQTVLTGNSSATV